jgi:hypothetical protein
MKFLICMLLVPAVSSAAAPVPTSSFQDEAGWIYQGEDSTGVRLWKKEIPGSPVVAFRGESTIEASIPRLASVLGDAKRRTEWVADAKESRDVRVESMSERVEYNRTGAPWPVQDRDFVYRVSVDVKREPQPQLAVHIKSVEEPSVPPRDGVVRAQLMSSRYLFTALDATHTRAAVEIHADPKGDLPKWLVNLVQQNWPKTTLIRLARQVAKDYVVENLALRAYFDSGKIPEGWEPPKTLKSDSKGLKAEDHSAAPAAPHRGA